MSDSEASREDRQLPASERRLQRAREEGQVARSRDLVHLAVLAGFLGMVLMAGSVGLRHVVEFLANGLTFDRVAVTDPARMLSHVGQLSMEGLKLGVVLPIALAILAVAASLAVGGWNLTLSVLTPNFSRLNPVSGLGRLFAGRHLLNHARVALVAATLVGLAIWHVARGAGGIAGLDRMPLEAALAIAMRWPLDGLLLLFWAVALFAAVDIPLQLFSHRSELRMTLEEVKQENKESEGDPYLKGERRRRQRTMSRSRMLKAVPSADVVVVNPTHYAVALRYDEKSMQAPRIVALGVDHIALKIREVAGAAMVPVLDAPPLARALYRHGRLDGEIPVALYTAVAQLLAYVAHLRNGMRPTSLPQLEIPAGMDPLEGGKA